MRPQRRPAHASYSKGSSKGAASPHSSPMSETVSIIRTFTSESNPSRPVRPSPLTRSAIRDMPLDMLDRIRSFPLFKSAPESFLAAIGAHLRPQIHSPHDYILTEGDEAKAMYWIVRGAVGVTSRDGESTYAELKPGAFFGEIGVLMSIPRTATIIARTKCLLVVLKKEDLAKELPNFPEVERTIREEAIERLAILESKKREKKALQVAAVQNGAVGGRREKRPREDADSGSALIHPLGAASVASASNISVVSSGGKKRKSPSPGIAEFAAGSALGSSTLHIRQLLRELPVFSGLPPEILHFLGASAKQCNFPPFHDIIKQDSQGREVYFIVQGEVEVIDEKASSPGVSSGSSKDKITNLVGKLVRKGAVVKARLKQGSYFGEVASLSLAPRRTATVRSVTSVECLLITGAVLNEFWSMCPPQVRQQVEQTARERLSSTGENDVIMTDVSSDGTPPIDRLQLADRKHPKHHKRPSVSSKSSSAASKSSTTVRRELSTKAPQVRERPVREPIDPDPYLNADLNNVRMRSRRSAEAAAENGEKRSPLNSSGRSPHYVSPSGSARSESPVRPKRPRTISRRPSRYSKGTLPNDILIRIFSYLELHHLMRARLVSLHWAKLAKDSPELLRHLDLSRYNRKITDRTLTNCIAPFVGTRPRMIDISNCFHLTDEGFTALVTMCGENVTTWKMKSVWDVSALAIHEMVKQAKDLEDVDLSNCRKVNDALLMHIIGNVPLQAPPPLGNNTMNHHHHSNNHHPSPHHLSNNRQYHRHPYQQSPPSPAPMTVHPNHQLPPTTILGSQKLKKLTLSYCKHVSDRSMAHIGTYARSRLEEVDLTRCTTITDHGFEAWGQHQFARLTKLCLADCTYLTDSAIIFLTNAAPQLRHLDLSFCCALSDTATEVLALGCPYLVYLDLSFCGSAVSDPSLRSIGLHLLEMRFLSVRGCVRVTGLGVEAVVDGCHKLEAFDVSQCKNLGVWLAEEGPKRVRQGVKFNRVAGGW